MDAEAFRFYPTQRRSVWGLRNWVRYKHGIPRRYHYLWHTSRSITIFRSDLFHFYSHSFSPTWLVDNCWRHICHRICNRTVSFVYKQAVLNLYPILVDCNCAIAAMKYITPDIQMRSERNTAQLLFRSTRWSQQRIAGFIKDIPPQKQ